MKPRASFAATTCMLARTRVRTASPTRTPLPSWARRGTRRRWMSPASARAPSLRDHLCRSIVFFLKRPFARVITRRVVYQFRCAISETFPWVEKARARPIASARRKSAPRPSAPRPSAAGGSGQVNVKDVVVVVAGVVVALLVPAPASPSLGSLRADARVRLPRASVLLVRRSSSLGTPTRSALSIPVLLPPTMRRLGLLTTPKTP